MAFEITTTLPLNADEVFEIPGVDTLEYGVIQIFVKASHDSSAAGLVFEASHDNVTYVPTNSYDYVAGTIKTYSLAPAARYFKIRFTNGPTIQTNFVLQVTFKTLTSSNSLAVDTTLGESAGITDVGGKPSLDVNVTNISINPDDDAIETRGMPLSLLVDKVTTANVMYIGEASPGVSESSPVWRIFIIDKTTAVTKKKYADGNGDYDNIWANRASLTYT